ncbi:hypothetical protein J1N35_043322 [Gossypium stocksii]|uniref:Aminotransferase-like plant mobile domain-containing protein n=1 Tax=Gossypium stocksii TaxID=47602 RepID=A0A9D3ZFA3_9ROSI|nr:hypothetical protein J1N35_043322 [Gossypium stocksii]
MAQQLIHLDDKHIIVNQMQMYLREKNFWHVANICRWCKLDPKLISAFVERWRPNMHTFHLPCGECTITLEDVQLQLGLPVDGSVFTRSAQSVDWGAICYDLLGAISDNIYEDHRRLFDSEQVTKPRISKVAAETHQF